MRTLLFEDFAGSKKVHECGLLVLGYTTLLPHLDSASRDSTCSKTNDSTLSAKVTLQVLPQASAISASLKSR